MTDQLPAQVQAAYGLQPQSVRAIPSLINRTFFARDATQRALIVQRLHPVFSPAVNQNMLAVTQRLKAVGLPTPELVAGRDGQWWLQLDGDVWRAQTYLEGTVLHRLDSAELAFHAGQLVARFHRGLWGWRYEFVGLRQGVHDTPAHLAALAKARATAKAHGERDVADVATELIEAGRSWVGDFSALPLRHSHGDLKASNLLFRPRGEGFPEGLCLIDLDTLGPQSLAYELGDALRSWCNDATEDASTADFRVDRFEAAVEGYTSEAPGGLLPTELDALVPGLLTISVELGARFCVDAVEDSYFGWDPARFGSRREHNLARAKNQLALARGIAREQSHLRQITDRAQRWLRSPA